MLSAAHKNLIVLFAIRSIITRAPARFPDQFIYVSLELYAFLRSTGVTSVLASIVSLHLDNFSTGETTYAVLHRWTEIMIVMIVISSRGLPSNIWKS